MNLEDALNAQHAAQRDQALRTRRLINSVNVLGPCMAKVKEKEPEPGTRAPLRPIVNRCVCGRQISDNKNLCKKLLDELTALYEAEDEAGIMAAIALHTKKQD